MQHGVNYVGSAGVAYDSSVLHPSITRTGRYAAPFKPYIWRGVSDFGLGVSRNR